MKTARLEILLNSLEKKKLKQSSQINAHFSDVRLANGQPLNDKRNGVATLRRWVKQNQSIRNLDASIEKTESAIARENSTIAHVKSVRLPEALCQALEAGEITQWRKHPRMFFVPGVDRGRICWDVKTQLLGHRYLSAVPPDQFPLFRDTFNKLSHKVKSGE